jgi:hypothetical protein
MKHLVVAWLAMGCLASSLVAENKDTVTVIRQGAGGEVQVIQTERDADEPEYAPRTTSGEQPEANVARRARVMVVPAIYAREQRRRIDRYLNERFNITDPGIIENPGFTSYIIDALVNTRKFDMLEREELKTLVREMQFGESEFADPSKVQAIGKMGGADYAVMPEIRYLELDRVTSTVPYIGGQTGPLKAKLATTIRTVDVATGRIISSNIASVEKEIRPRENASMRIVIQDLLSECFKECAIREAAIIVDVAYPIRIMSISGDTVMINRGRGAILPGEELKVYAIGEVMIDPDTGENLGYQESYVGKIKISDIDQKTSKAKIVESVAPIKRLYVARREKLPSSTKPVQMNAPPKID